MSVCLRRGPHTPYNSFARVHYVCVCTCVYVKYIGYYVTHRWPVPVRVAKGVGAGDVVNMGGAEANH